MSQVEELLIKTADEIDELAERLNELADWAEEMDYDAVADKIHEGRGRIMSAADAARQYADGTLPTKAPPAYIERSSGL